MTRSELYKKDRNLYEWLCRNHRDVFDRYFPRSKNKYTIDVLKEISKKYKTRKEFQVSNRSAYNSAYNAGILDDICKHMPITYKNWTLKECRDIALKYKYKSEFRKNHNKIYAYARKRNWLEFVEKGLIDQFRWTKELVLLEAKKYNSRMEWKKNNKFSYNAACRYDWLKEATQKMINKSGIPKYVLNIEKQKIFSSIVQASLSVGKSKGAVFNALKHNHQKCGGYHWAYCDADGNIIDNTKKKK